MVLAAVCTVDPAHANEQLTARFRFLTGTTHAYIQHLLSNLQPKLEGTSSATQYLSKVILSQLSLIRLLPSVAQSNRPNLNCFSILFNNCFLSNLNSVITNNLQKLYSF